MQTMWSRSTSSSQQIPHRHRPAVDVTLMVTAGVARLPRAADGAAAQVDALAGHTSDRQVELAPIGHGLQAHVQTQAHRQQPVPRSIPVRVAQPRWSVACASAHRVTEIVQLVWKTNRLAILVTNSTCTLFFVLSHLSSVVADNKSCGWCPATGTCVPG